MRRQAARVPLGVWMTASNRLFAAIEGNSDYFRDGRFHHWIPGAMSYEGMAKAGFPGGYKMHVSAHQDDAETIAGLVLPLLRELNIYHKIASSPHEYEMLNSGRQQGKFITVYCGPLMDTFTGAVNRLDAVLATSRTRPGARPSLRLGQGYEKKIGTTGHLSYFEIDDFQK